MRYINILSMAAALAFASSSALAETDLDATLNKGGQLLNSDEIAALLVGNVVTAISGKKEFRFYYDPANVLSGELTNGGWEGSGAFAITDTNQVCVSMAADKSRYRCLNVVRHGDVVYKFNTKGKMTFELVSFKPSTGL